MTHLQKFNIDTTGKEGTIIYNFSPGPCVLPRAVLDEAAANMVDYKGTGQSVLELSHFKPYWRHIDTMGKAELRKFLKVPDEFVIMFAQGGATMQYTSFCKNLIGLRPARKAMYVTTGLWSSQCWTEAQKFIPADKLIEVTNTKESNYTKLTDPKTWNIDPEASYIHICMNETVNGFEFTEENFPWHLIPKDVCVIGDMSSNIGTREINWDRFGVIYGGAQKNLGPAGNTVIIVRKSLLGHAEPDVPVLCDWKGHEEAPGKYYNTPAIFPVYVTGLNCSYMNQAGGLSLYDREADIKSGMLYKLIDNSNGYYVNYTEKAYRSRMNCNFRIPHNLALEAKFIKEAEEDKILNIAGHAKNPGIRISMYNAMPVAGCLHLMSFMERFMRENPVGAGKL